MADHLLFPLLAAVEPADAPTPLLVFHHIQKTAGTSVRGVLRGLFRQDELLGAVGSPFRIVLSHAAELGIEPAKLSQDDMRQWTLDLTARELADGKRCFITHLHGQGLENILKALTPPPVLFTFLRDPVPRAISHLRHCEILVREHVEGDRFAPEYQAKLYRSLHGATVNDMITDGRPGLETEVRKMVWNYQARFLTGAPLSVSPKSMLEQAKAVLESYAFVGIMERFAESMRLFNYTFGLPPMLQARSARRNVTTQKLERLGMEQSDISTETIAALREMTAVDQALYEWASERFLEIYGDMIEAVDGAGLEDAQVDHLLDAEFRRRVSRANEDPNHPLAAGRSATIDFAGCIIGEGWGWPHQLKDGAWGRYADGQSSLYLNIERRQPTTLTFLARRIRPRHARALAISADGRRLPTSATRVENGCLVTTSLPRRDGLEPTKVTIEASRELVESRPPDRTFFVQKIELQPAGQGLAVG